MKPIKNYIISAILIVITVFLTLFLSNLYKNNQDITSNFYNYSNKITSVEFDEYIIEHSDVIIYISAKNDLSHENFEMFFQKKLDNLNLKENLIYIDKEELNKKFIEKLKKEYNIIVDENKLPLLIQLVDKKVIKSTYINNDIDVETILNYGELK